MQNVNLRTESEMMKQLALIAVRTVSDFHTDGSQITLPNGRGDSFTYDVEFLDICFIEQKRTDCIVRFHSTIAPFAPPFYCLLSELEDSE